MEKRKTIVVGAGVIGLTTGNCLLDAGFDVEIVATAVHPHITSSVAAALWYPFKAYPADKVTEWSLSTYSRFAQLSEDPATGVSMIDTLQVCDHPLTPPDWTTDVDGFRLLGVNEMPAGYSSGYHLVVPLIETPIYMPWLLNRFEMSGGHVRILPEPIVSFDELEYEAIIVNCTGLGAAILCNDDEMYPVKGQVVRVANPGVSMAVCDDEGSAAVCYVIPRTDDCILGGSAEKGVWDDAPDAAVTESILARCRVLVPELRDVQVLSAQAALRPGRRSVRVEKEVTPSGRIVVHNYGHGGAGYTLSWGCAWAVVSLAG